MSIINIASTIIIIFIITINHYHLLSFDLSHNHHLTFIIIITNTFIIIFVLPTWARWHFTKIPSFLFRVCIAPRPTSFTIWISTVVLFQILIRVGFWCYEVFVGILWVPTLTLKISSRFIDLPSKFRAHLWLFAWTCNNYDSIYTLKPGFQCAKLKATSVISIITLFKVGYIAKKCS